VEIHLLPRMPPLLTVVAAVALTVTLTVLVVVQAVAEDCKTRARILVLVHLQRPLGRVTQAATQQRLMLAVVEAALAQWVLLVVVLVV
jgi:hypothetical protein